MLFSCCRSILVCFHGCCGLRVAHTWICQTLCPSTCPSVWPASPCPSCLGTESIIPLKHSASNTSTAPLLFNAAWAHTNWLCQCSARPIDCWGKQRQRPGSTWVWTCCTLPGESAAQRGELLQFFSVMRLCWAQILLSVRHDTSCFFSGKGLSG